MFILLTAADCLFQALVDFEADIRAPQTPSGQVDDPVNRFGSGEFFPLPAQPSYQIGLNLFTLMGLIFEANYL
jgi:hypothetical protein